MTDLPLFDQTRAVNAAEQGARIPAKRPKPERAKTLQEAAARRDDGIERALSHADRVKAEWRKWVYDYFKGLIRLKTGPFLTEDLVEMALKEVIWSPAPNPKAYGGIMQKLAHDGIIKKVGAAPARTSNCSLKVLWARVESADEAVILNKPEGL